MEILVYDKLMNRKGALGGASSVEFTLVANGVGEATVTISADRPRVADAMLAGARLVISEPGVVDFSGTVMSVAGSGPKASSVVLTVREDSRILWDWLAWPAPDKRITAQGQAYAKYTGAAEKILKDVVNANRSRFSEHVVCAPNLNRGATITGGVQFRFHPIADRLMTAFESAGLILKVLQVGSQIVVDVREQKTVPKPLSVASGNLVSWEWNRSAPASTRVAAGGQGVGESRYFTQLVKTTLESGWGFGIEKFVDARDSDDEDEIWGRVEEAITEGASKSGLKADLVQSKSFRYGTHYQVGDKVTVDLTGQSITDILRTTTFRWTREAGFETLPEVGERSDDPDLALAKKVRALQKGLTHLKVSY